MPPSQEPFLLDYVDDVPVLRMRGLLNVREEAEAARQQVEVLVDTNQIDRLIVDCSEARAMNSTIIGMIMQLHLKLRIGEGMLRLCGLSDNLRDMCRVARIDDVLPIDDTLDEAVTALKD